MTVAFAAVFLMAVSAIYVILLTMKAGAEKSGKVCMNFTRKVCALGAYVKTITGEIAFVKGIPTPFWNAFDDFASKTVRLLLSVGTKTKFSCELGFQIFIVIIIIIVMATAVKIFIQMFPSALALSFAPTAVSGLVRIFGSLILWVHIRAGFVVCAILSGLLSSFVVIFSCGIAASLLVAASTWAVSATILAALGICSVAPAPDQPSVSHIFSPW